MRPNARRIEALERRMRERSSGSPARGEVREYLSEQLSRLAAARRGELSEGEEAEVRAFWAAFERRAAEARGEGYR
jgi:hypothetical protein